MTSAPDMVTMTDNDLARLADIVFRQGLKDGRAQSHPRTRDLLHLLLPVMDCRQIHTAKLRQIYGAGFDIAAANERIAAREGEE